MAWFFGSSAAVATIAVVGGLVGSPALGRPATADSTVQIGKEIVVRDCGGCHAVGRKDKSPFAPAPPFRTFGQKYEVTGLAESLAEGIFVGHPAMPQFAYPVREVDAIIAYLSSIQATPAGRAKP